MNSKLIGNLVFFFVIFTAQVNGQTRTSSGKVFADPRGEPQLTVCSQNLNNYGFFHTTAGRLNISEEAYQIKERALAERIVKTGCDVVAVQEVFAPNEEAGREVLRQLAKRLRFSGGRIFDVSAGSSNDDNIRNGFLLAKDRAEIINTLSYSKVELPKISDKQKPRFFLRSPYEIQIAVKPRELGSPKTVTLINIHFKSKSGSGKDPTELEWETYRMEMSEAVRRIVEVRHRGSIARGDNLLLVVGDRNSHFDTASSKILEGSLTLADFKMDSYCRLSKRGTPLCQPGASSSQVLFSVLTENPRTKMLPGTYRYRNIFSWIDDILMPVESLPFAWAQYDTAGEYDSGVVYEPAEASDHAMVYVRLYW